MAVVMKMTRLDIGKPILELNDRLAVENRRLLDKHGIFMLDLLASPGAGKTSLILATIRALREDLNIAVIEGDIASDVDAQKIKAEGVPAVQINTGGACHLESAMIARALSVLDLPNLDLIIVENVGNLVCPTDFYLGENAKVMILSVPEGHDKPLKYPGVFQAASAIILNKIDTLGVFNFNQEQFGQDVRNLNPAAPIFPVNSTGYGEDDCGIAAWTNWLLAQIAAQIAAQNATQISGLLTQSESEPRLEHNPGRESNHEPEPEPEPESEPEPEPRLESKTTID
jgi:hydrogenase nickel incorporation protein HypB